jgi:hypothetical protein
VRHHGGVDAGGSLQPLQQLALQRRRISRAPGALPLLGAVDHVFQRLVRAVGGGIDHLGIGEHVHQRLQILVGGLRRAQERGIDEGGRGGVKDRAVRGRALEAGHGIGAGAAGDVLDHDIGAERRGEVLAELAQEDVAAAADTRVGDQGDRIVRVILGRCRGGENSRPEQERGQQD